MLACDLENAYLNSPCQEKIWFEGRQECGEDQGKVLVITRALYGLKSVGSSWRSSLAEALRNLKCKSTRAVPDVWICLAVREDGHEYYEMLFVYVDDILAISHQARKVVELIGEVYKIKAGSDKEPDIYMGADVEKFQLPDGRKSGQHPQDHSEKRDQDSRATTGRGWTSYVLKNNAKNPFPSNYKPELDVTDELGKGLASRYLQLIGIGRWAIELGRLDIFHKIALLSQCQASP